VIMKSIFTPDMGDQKNLVITKVDFLHMRGFLTYNLSRGGNYFDCNMLDTENNFYKVYIKDKKAQVSLEQALAIISTLKRAAN
jgi:hypothetical protein